MATLKDVARLAGVSSATVSRVLNNSDLVRPETVKSVKDAMKLLSYSPNLLATSLRSNSSRLIGLVVPSSKHSYFANLVYYTSNYCFKNGYGLIIGNHNDDPQLEEELIEYMYSRNVDGLILSLVSDESRAFGKIAQHRTPTIIFDRETQEEYSRSVLLNNYQTGILAGEHLAQLGHKTIACITGPMSIKQCRDRLSGINDALEQHGLSIQNANLKESTFDFQSGFEVAKKIFIPGKNHPTAIWAQDDLIAAGVMQYLHLCGYRVPQDVSVIGLDDLELASMLAPKLTTISQPLREMSRFAVEMILDMRTSQDQKQEIRKIFEPTLVVRETTAAIV